MDCHGKRYGGYGWTKMTNFGNMEKKICCKFRGTRLGKDGWSQTWFYDLEYNMVKPCPSLREMFFGNQRWFFGSLLGWIVVVVSKTKRSIQLAGISRYSHCTIKQPYTTIDMIVVEIHVRELGYQKNSTPLLIKTYLNFGMNLTNIEWSSRKDLTR